MSSWDVGMLIWILLATLGLTLELIGRMEVSRIPPLSSLLGAAMRTRVGRIGILGAWLWVGLHFFSK